MVCGGHQFSRASCFYNEGPFPAAFWPVMRYGYTHWRRTQAAHRARRKVGQLHHFNVTTPALQKPLVYTSMLCWPRLLKGCQWWSLDAAISLLSECPIMCLKRFLSLCILRITCRTWVRCFSFSSRARVSSAPCGLLASLLSSRAAAPAARISKGIIARAAAPGTPVQGCV